MLPANSGGAIDRLRPNNFRETCKISTNPTGIQRKGAVAAAIFLADMEVSILNCALPRIIHGQLIKFIEITSMAGILSQIEHSQKNSLSLFVNPYYLVNRNRRTYLL